MQCAPTTIDETNLDTDETSLDTDKTNLDTDKTNLDTDKTSLDTDKTSLDTDETNLDAEIDRIVSIYCDLLRRLNGNRFYLVAFLNAVDDIHTVQDSAENRIFAVEIGLWCECDVELTAR